MIGTIIFDIDGVLINTDFDSVYTNFARRTGMDLDTIIEMHANRTKLDQMLLGYFGFSDLMRSLDKNANIKKCAEIWIEESLKLTVINSELMALVDRLRSRYHLVILSHLTEGRFLVDQKLQLYTHFDDVVLSFKEHLMKRDRKFFELALAKSGSRPDEAIFIDDKEKHVLEARAIGIIKSIVALNNHQIRSELAGFGVEL